MQKFILFSLIIGFLFSFGCENKKKSTTPKNDSSKNPPPLIVESPVNKIKQLIASKKFSEAYSKTMELLKKSPDNAEYLYYAGFTSFNLKKTKEALKWFERAIKAGGNTKELYVNYSETLYFLKEFEKCKVVIIKAMKKFPKAAGLWYNMAGIYIEQNNMEKAKEFLNEALMRNPNYPPALLTLGSIYYGEKKMDEAVKTFKKLLKIKGFKVKGYLKLAYIEIKRHNFKESISLLNSALKIDPQNKMALRFKKVASSQYALMEIASLLKNKKCKIVRGKIKQFKKEFPKHIKIKYLAKALSIFCP